MEPKEKSKKLVENFRHNHIKGKVFTDDFNPKREERLTNEAKQCALIAVEEIITSWKEDGHRDLDSGIGVYWWQKVKQEIEKL